MKFDLLMLIDITAVILKGGFDIFRGVCQSSTSEKEGCRWIFSHFVVQIRKARSFKIVTMWREADVRFKRTEKRTSTQWAKEATPIEDPPRVTTNATRERGIRRNKIAPDSKKTKKTTHDHRREDLSWEKESKGLKEDARPGISPL